MRGLADEGTTVFLTTQMLDEAESLADRIAVLSDGRIIADGTAADLTALAGAQRLDDAFLAISETTPTPEGYAA